MGKVVKKIAKSVSKLTRSKFLDPLGISKSVSLSPVEDTLSGRSEGIFQALTAPDAKLNADAAASAEARQLAEQRRIAQNANVDLSTENVPDIETGGTAEMLGGTGRRRRRQGQSLSSAIGINV